jgi:hypothetical protein
LNGMHNAVLFVTPRRLASDWIICCSMLYSCYSSQKHDLECRLSLTLLTCSCVCDITLKEIRVWALMIRRLSFSLSNNAFLSISHDKTSNISWH